MSNEVQQFDVSALKQRVAESVQSTFGMLIPEDQWNALVAKEVSAFFDEEKEMKIQEVSIDGSYNRSKGVILQGMTPFRNLVYQEINNIVQQKVKDQFNNKEWLATQTWTNNMPTGQLGTALESKLEAMAPTMVAEMFRGVFAMASISAKNEVLASLGNRNY